MEGVVIPGTVRAEDSDHINAVRFAMIVDNSPAEPLKECVANEKLLVVLNMVPEFDDDSIILDASPAEAVKQLQTREEEPEKVVMRSSIVNLNYVPEEASNQPEINADTMIPDNSSAEAAKNPQSAIKDQESGARNSRSGRRLQLMGMLPVQIRNLW